MQVRACVVMAFALAVCCSTVASAKSVQDAGDLFQGLPYLWVEGEDATVTPWTRDVDESRPELATDGWVVVNPGGTLDVNGDGTVDFVDGDGNPRATLPSDTNASNGALLIAPDRNLDGDGNIVWRDWNANTFDPTHPNYNARGLATYQVQFATAGTYQLYMRYSKYEVTGDGGYGNEDSIWVPPAFNAHPTYGWEGAVGLGWPGATDPTGPPVEHIGDSARDGWMPLTNELISEGVLVDAGDPADGFWEGQFHWRHVDVAVEVENPTTFIDDFGAAIQYEVTAEQVGETLTFQVAGREKAGVVDGFLFVKQEDRNNLLDITSQGVAEDGYTAEEDDFSNAINYRPSVPDDPTGLGREDINQDGRVDASDAGLLFAAWTGEAPSAAAGEATASYNYMTGLIEISANGVVNAFVESASGGLTPGNADAAPAGLLASDNASRVGLTGFGGINVTNWKSQNSTGLAEDDLSLVVGPALGVPSVTHAAGSANFTYVPEPATAGLFGLGLLGMVAARRRS